MMKLFRRRTESNQRGQAQVEFLLSAIFLITLILISIELILLLYTYVVIAGAAKEGVRYAIVHGSGVAASGADYSQGPSTGSAHTCSSSSNDNASSARIVSAVNTYANYSGMTVIVCYLDGTNAAPNQVQVQVSYPYTTVFSLGLTTPTVRASALGRITN
jgi:Flp pilus assembly protein TadG